MKKILAILLICLASNFGAKAQYVNIPDTAFGKFLLAQYPSCLYKDASNLYWMDTTCSGVVNETFMNCYNFSGTNNIQNLEGIQYFKKLNQLYCFANLINNIPSLPDSLQTLDCSFNQLTSLPLLPNSLYWIKCNNNQLNSLPTLPTKLWLLDCSYNQVTSLPTLPTDLRGLVCNNNLINTIPTLPTKMDSLICNDNPSLSCLPKLPDGLSAGFQLRIDNTNIQCIPNNSFGLRSSSTLPPICNSTNNPNNCPILAAPAYVNIPDTSFGKFLLAQYPSCLYKDASNLYWMDTTCSGVVNETFLNCDNKGITDLTGIEYFDSLKLLWCSNNQLIILPVLPDSLIELLCSNNKLTNLPNLPNTLTGLNCSFNLLTSLPALPSKMDSLFCGNNINLSCLPKLPNGVQSFFDLQINNTNIQCLPNIPSGLNIISGGSYPICNRTNNPNNCQIIAAPPYVNIPDTAFGKFLLAQYPSCLYKDASNKYWMDTTCSGVVNADTLIVDNLNISNLEGLQYLDSLKVLECSNNNITTIPQLPKTLEWMICENTLLNSLPTLPLSLKLLNCGNNPNLHCLPLIPYNIQNLAYSSPATCIPNYINQQVMCTWAVSVCDASNNSNNCNTANGKYINIRDNGLRQYLINSNPQFFNDYGQLDTVLAATYTRLDLYSVPNVDCQMNPLNVDLETLKYFTSLKELTIFDTKILGDFSNYLSDSIEVLNISASTISNNKLTKLPSKLKEFYFEAVNIDTLPPLPSTLVTLSMSDISGGVPNISWQYWNSPFYAQQHNTQLSFLPTLPLGLKTLHIDAENLDSLPINLPVGLNSLAIRSKKITSIGTLPNSLNQLGIFKTQLQCLPVLPNSLTYLSIDTASNTIKCLPNLPSSTLIYNNTVATNNSLTLPICNPTNNANQCQSFPYIFGRVFTDNNSNGVKDANEFYRPFVKINASNGDATYTNTSGAYAISLDSVGSYTLKAQAPPFFKALPDSNSFNVANYNATLGLPDIALQPIVTKDSLAIIAVPITNRARPGFAFAYSVGYANTGTTNLFTTTSFVYDDAKLNYDSSSTAIISHTGNTITIPTNSVIAGQSGSFKLYFTVKTTTAIGDTIKVLASISATGVSESSANVTIVRGSYDPNDKQATPELSPTQLQNGENVEYVIRFQNTGNDTAVNVVISDTLSNLLVASNVNVIATSHLANISYKIQNNIVYFEFKNINLPDSAANYFASMGWVKFMVKPLQTLALGTYIDNKAHIYFDYNKNIETNTARTLIKNPSLPVKISNYEVRNTSEPTKNEKQVTNFWTVANQINVSHYNVQRSVDGKEFKTVGQVKASNTDNYSFTDALTNVQLPTTLYYRIMTVDNDGSIAYSIIKTIVLNEKQATRNVLIYPNPAKDVVNITAVGMREIRISDMFGKTIKQFNTNTDYQTINTQQFTKGIYLIKVILNNGEVKTEKLIVE